jgi:hypothetical protein
VNGIPQPDVQERLLDFTALTRYRADSGEPEEATSPLDGRVFLGGPVAFLMTGKRYPDMSKYLAADAAHHQYFEVHLSLSFKDADKSPPLYHVSLSMHLRSTNGTERPIAWSMAPDRINDPISREISFEIRPQIKVAGVVEASVGGVSGSSPLPGEPFLIALGELGPDPSWELRRSGKSLDGRQRLILVVRAVKDADVEIGMEVTASTKTSVLRRFRALPGPLLLSAPL